MVIYSCEICGYETKHKETFKRHLNRKKPCQNETTVQSGPSKTLNFPHFVPQKPSFSLKKPSFSLISSQQENDCIYCGKRFKRKDNLKRHMERSCKIMKFQMDELESKNMELESENKQIKSKTIELEKKIEKLENTLNIGVSNNDNGSNINQHINNVNINNANVNSGNTNNIHTNITINSFGNESIDHLNEQYFKNLLILPGMALQKLIKDIHCNPEIPQNHNLKKTNKNDKFIQYYDGKDWNIEDKRKILDNLVEMTFTILENTADRHEDIDQKYLNRFEQFRDKFYENKEGVKTKNMSAAEIMIINNSKNLDKVKE